MAELEKFTCTFVGRLKGATGVMYLIETTVVCTFNSIVPKLYEKYEHVVDLRIVDSHGHTINAKLARTMSDWNDD